MFFKMATITRLLQPCKSFKILNKFVLFEKVECNSPLFVFTASYAKKVPGLGMLIAMTFYSPKRRTDADTRKD